MEIEPTTKHIQVNIRLGVVVLTSLALVLLLAIVNKWLLPLPWYVNTFAVALAVAGGLVAGTHAHMQPNAPSDRPTEHGRNSTTRINTKKNKYRIVMSALVGLVVCAVLIAPAILNGEGLSDGWHIVVSLAIGMQFALASYISEREDGGNDRPADAYHPPLLDALDDVMFHHKSDDPAIQQAYEDDVDHARSMVRAIEALFLDDTATTEQLELLRSAGFGMAYPYLYTTAAERRV